MPPLTVSDAAWSVAQAEILASELLETGFNCLVQMPTGSGKTWLAEQAIDAVLSRGARAIYLAPLRALAAELAARWQGRFGGAQVGVFTGDFGRGGKAYPVPFREAQLLIMTPERLDACTRAWRSHWSWLPEVDVLIVDEFHLLGEGRRGACLEGVISRARRLNPFLAVLGFSATLGNRNELAGWLAGVEYCSDRRPVPLFWRIVRYRQASEKPGLLVREVARTIQSGGKSLVFVQSRRRSEDLSRSLEASGLCAHHHHAGLSYEERGGIEAAFRGTSLDCLVATSTLELGMNLPARQVILYDIQTFDGTFYQPLSTNSVWQRVGRAGRRGLDTRGEAVLFAAAWDRQACVYERGEFEPIRSGLSAGHLLAEQIIAEVSSGLATTRVQLDRIFATSLAAHQQRLPEVGAVVEEMCQAGMLRVEEAAENREGVCQAGRLAATHLGRIASRHLLDPSTLLLFQRVLVSEPAPTFLDLLLFAAASEECEPLLPVDFEELSSLAASLEGKPSALLHRSREQVIELLGIRGRRLLSALKMALVGRACTRSPDTAATATAFGCYPFEVERLHRSFERLLLAMTEVGESLGGDSHDDSTAGGWGVVPTASRIRALQRMIATGLDEGAATLTLVAGIGPGHARRLFAAGVLDLEDLALAEPGDVCQLRGVSLARAACWIDEAVTLVRSTSAFRYREHDAPPVRLAPVGWPTDVDVYRLRRALELQLADAGDGHYQVTGGQEPHIVRVEGALLCCDCLDAGKGYQCKHMLAVRLHRADRELQALVQRLGAYGQEADGWLDLCALWLEREPPPQAGRWGVWR